MAEVVKRKLRKQRSYPWTEWVRATLDQPDAVVVAVRGEDFDVEVESFRVGVHQAAYVRSLKAVTTVDGEKVSFRFYTPEE